MSRPPAVSVIIPAFRISAYIAEALDSVFAQTYTDFEVILVNDGSPDTDELEAALAPYRSRIQYLKQERGGVSAARNLGIRHARGEFLAFLDGDDVWLPQCLETHMEWLRLHPELDMVWADLQLFGAGPTAGRTLMSLNASERPVTLARLVQLRASPFTSAVLVRRSAVIDAGLFDEALSRSEDFDLWLRLAQAGCRLDFHRTLVGRRRIHGSAASYDHIAMLKAILVVLDKLAAPGVTGEDAAAVVSGRARVVAWLRHEEGRVCLLEGRFREAAAAFREGAAHCGSAKANLLLAGLRVAPRLTRALFKLRARQ